jgi:GT2 family glycosyltransferase
MKTPCAVTEHKCGSQTQVEPYATGMARLIVLLVNYNGMQYLGPCLESIRRFAPPNTKVVMEDNASTDGSTEAVEKNYPWVQTVRSAKNLGFSGGNNLAGKNVQGEFILLLNTDTLLLESIAPVVDWLKNHASYGAVTINMLDGDHTPRACTGRFPSPLRLALLRSMLIAPEKYSAEEAYEVDWVQGSFLLIRTDLWNTLNGLDERYFMYVEDVDLCRRIWDTGFRCAYLPRWQYLHWGGYNLIRFPEQIGSLATYVDLHFSGARWMLCHAVLFGSCLMKAACYGAKSLLCKRDINQAYAKTCWRAFEVLIKRQR